MSAILDALFGWLKAVFDKLWKFIEDNLLLILIVVAIWYAPMLATYFESVGMPWLSSAFSWVGSNLTPLLVDAVSFVTGPFTEGGMLYDLFVSESVGMGVKALIAIGGMYLLAPEETAAVVEAVAEFAGEVVGDIASAFISGAVGSSFGTTAMLIGAGLLAWWFFSSSSEEEKVVISRGSDDG